MDPVGKKHIIYKPIKKTAAGRTDAKTVKIFPNPSTQSTLKVAPSAQLLNLNEKAERTNSTKSGRMKYLTDRINYMNFKDEPILINFHHKQHDYKVTKHVLPQPCQGDTLECHWTDISDLVPVFKNYHLKEVMVPDNNKVLMIKPELLSVTRKRIVLKLPKQYEEVNKRRVTRYDAKNIRVQMIQNSIVYNGQLMDFSTMAFHIRLDRSNSPTFKWINSDAKVNVIFMSGKDTVYSGECLIFKQSGNSQQRDIVLEPMNFQIQRFKPKEYRSPRQKLVPSPDAIFMHPLHKKTIQLKTLEMSGSGFSVEESKEDALLLPGLVTPDTVLKFGNQFTLRCRAQVVYSQADNSKHDCVRCGLTILDMDVNDHMSLLALLGQAEDGHSYLCDQVDMDLLWDFFFRNGVIYSDNYESLHKNKEAIKKTYEALYTGNPHIARHFIYQDKGAILGHMAMLRFYEKSWLMCLHSSRNSISQLTQRLSLLNQVSRYVYESYAFASSNLDFLITYFDSNDKFSKSVFQGIARSTKSNKGCSLDILGYLRYTPKIKGNNVMPEDYELTNTVPEDLAILESFYESKSGGLMLEALDLLPEQAHNLSRLSTAYRHLGFQRSRYLISIKKSGYLKALLMVNTSDLGLNMADLTGCIKIFITDPRNFSLQAMHTTLSRICRNLKKDSMPVFLYPCHNAADIGLVYEKTCYFWALDAQFTDQFFRQIKLLMEKQAPQNRPRP